MKMFQNEDTIAALATPSGAGAIAVIRVSGPGSISSAGQIFTGRIPLTEARSHTVHYGRIASSNGEVIDDVLVTVFRNPNSYTGEDSVEISTHGSPLIIQKVLQALFQQNVRPAEAGEFTRRAFMNGRLDLAQAEAVADVINSRTEASLRGARNQLDGLLSANVEGLRTSLLNISSMLELELDFAEEDIEFLSQHETASRLDTIIESLDRLLRSYSFGRVIRDGVNIAIVGKPNVGKSSLLNYLLKEARAIVSEIPGTTRDVIREELNVDGILLRLFDTAGIRLTEDAVEKEGVLRSRNAVKEADLVVFLSDITAGFDQELYEELSGLTKPERIIRAANKADLLTNAETVEADARISSKTGAGIEELLKLLKERAAGSDSYSERSAVVTNLRHYQALSRAKEYLLSSRETLLNGFTGEFVSMDIRNAIAALDEIIGRVTSEDVLNNIFSSFCIGK